MFLVHRQKDLVINLKCNVVFSIREFLIKIYPSISIGKLDSYINNHYDSGNIIKESQVVIPKHMYMWATFNELGGLYMCIYVVYMYVTIIIIGEVMNPCWREKWEWGGGCNDVNRVLRQKFSRKIIKTIFIITKNILSNFGNADVVTSCLSAFLPPVTLGLLSW